MNRTERYAKLEDRVRGALYDLTDGADWPVIPVVIAAEMDKQDNATYGEMDDAIYDWRAKIVKAAVAEIMDQIAGAGTDWVEILAGVLDEDTDTIVTQLECDNALSDHDDVMLMELADPYNPREHAEYEVRERPSGQSDSLVGIRDAIAAKVGSGCAAVQVEHAPGGYETCPLVSITMPLSDARELAR